MTQDQESIALALDYIAMVKSDTSGSYPGWQGYDFSTTDGARHRYIPAFDCFITTLGNGMVTKILIEWTSWVDTDRYRAWSAFVTKDAHIRTAEACIADIGNGRLSTAWTDKIKKAMDERAVADVKNSVMRNAFSARSAGWRS